MIIFSSMDDPPLTEEELLIEGGVLLSAAQHISAAAASSARAASEKAASTLTTATTTTLTSSSLSSSSSSDFADEWDEISSLHEQPTFLPWHFIRQSVIPGVFLTAIVLAVIQQALYWLVFHPKFVTATKHIDNSNQSKTTNSTFTKNKETNDMLARRGSYQFTNLITNLFLSLLGTYYHSVLHNNNPSHVSVGQRISGYKHDFIALTYIQMGYQLWGLYMGLFRIVESRPMLLHHVVVSIITFMTGFFTNGFRYFTPFFFGMVELSSVPLAVMNYYKDAPKERIEKNPTVFLIVKLSFCAIFLWTRVILWVPQIYEYLILSKMLGMTCPTVGCTVVCGSFMTCGVILTVLQLWWGMKIVEGLWKLAFGNNNNNTPNKKKTNEGENEQEAKNNHELTKKENGLKHE